MNDPTLLTLARICLIPFLILFNYMPSPWSSWVSLGVFLIASITDWLDGYLARRNNQVTTLGKLLDPLADKLLVLTAFLVILERQFIDAWIVILLIGREMGITGLRAFLAAERIVLSASNLGKWKMTFQIISLSCLFIGGVAVPFLPAGLFPFLDDSHLLFKHVGVFTAYIALFFSLISAYFYIEKFWNLLGEKIMAEQNQKGKPDP